MLSRSHERHTVLIDLNTTGRAIWNGKTDHMTGIVIFHHWCFTGIYLFLMLGFFIISGLKQHNENRIDNDDNAYTNEKPFHTASSLTLRK